jgi:hypothetical protein
MIARMILQGLAATMIVAVLAFGYAASAQIPPQSAAHEAGEHEESER